MKAVCSLFLLGVLGLVGLVSLALPELCYAQAQPAAAAPARATPEAKVEDIHIKDEGASIDELRIRAETKRATVKPRNAPAYQIEPDSPRKAFDDKSQGKASWKLFTF